MTPYHLCCMKYSSRNATPAAASTLPLRSTRCWTLARTWGSSHCGYRLVLPEFEFIASSPPLTHANDSCKMLLQTALPTPLPCIRLPFSTIPHPRNSKRDVRQENAHFTFPITSVRTLHSRKSTALPSPLPCNSQMPIESISSK